MSERDDEDRGIPGARYAPPLRQHNPRGDEDVTPDPAEARFPIRHFERERRRRRRNAERT